MHCQYLATLTTDTSAFECRTPDYHIRIYKVRYVLEDSSLLHCYSRDPAPPDFEHWREIALEGNCDASHRLELISDPKLASRRLKDTGIPDQLRAWLEKSTTWKWHSTDRKKTAPIVLFKMGVGTYSQSGTSRSLVVVQDHRLSSRGTIIFHTPDCKCSPSSYSSTCDMQAYGPRTSL